MRKVGVQFDPSFGRIYYYLCPFDDVDKGQWAVVDSPLSGPMVVGIVDVVDGNSSIPASKTIMGLVKDRAYLPVVQTAMAAGRKTLESLLARIQSPQENAIETPAILPIRGNCLVHVNIAAILDNKEHGRHREVCVLRELAALNEPISVREALWDGPSRFVHHEFMTIEGTNVQNWVETDAPITMVRDGQRPEVLGGTGDLMTKHIRGRFAIHVAAPVLTNNRKTQKNDPVIAVRSIETNWASDVTYCRRVEWNGPTRMVHRPSTPVPGTNGRGVAFIETDAQPTIYLDDREPFLFVSQQQRSAA